MFPLLPDTCDVFLCCVSHPPLNFSALHPRNRSRFTSLICTMPETVAIVRPPSLCATFNSASNIAAIVCHSINSNNNNNNLTHIPYRPLFTLKWLHPPCDPFWVMTWSYGFFSLPCTIMC